MIDLTCHLPPVFSVTTLSTENPKPDQSKMYITKTIRH